MHAPVIAIGVVVVAREVKDPVNDVQSQFVLQRLGRFAAASSRLAFRDVGANYQLALDCVGRAIDAEVERDHIRRSRDVQKLLVQARHAPVADDCDGEHAALKSFGRRGKTSNFD